MCRFMYITYHFEHNIICITVRHQSSQRPAPCHAVSPAVIYYNQIAATCLDEFGAETNTRASTDDDFSIFDLRTEVF